MDRFGGIRDASGNLLTPGLLTAESARWGDGNPDLTLSLGYDDTSEYGPGWKTRAERITPFHPPPLRSKGGFKALPPKANS